MNLRDYQHAAHDAILASWGIAPWWDGERATYRSVVANLATSAGKTIIAAHLTNTLVERGARVLFVGDREELIQQPVEKFHKACGIIAAVHRGGDRASANNPVVVASIQTLGRRLPAGRPFDYIIDDEAHRNTEARKKIHDAYPGARIVGITATAFRKNMADLSKWYEAVAFELGTFDLIGQGYITPIKVLTLPLEVDLANVHQKSGDYDKDELAGILTPHYRAVARAIKEHAASRQILAFLPLISSSKEFVATLQSEGITAEHCDGQTDDRREVIHRFEEREFQVLSNSQVFSTGVDFIRADCMLNLAATRSRVEYRQRAGRIMRLLPGVIDPDGVTLPTPEERRAAIAASEKPDCVAEGTIILTDHGMVPIERVTKSMRVWDGICFAKHEGVIYKGERETITYQGLTATADHRVWTKEGWKTLGTCAEQQITIAVTGDGRDAIRLSEGYFTRTAEIGNEPEDAHGVCVLRRAGMEIQDYGSKWRGWLPGVFASAPSTEMVDGATGGGEAALREPQRQALSRLRREGYQFSFRYRLGGVFVGDEEFGIVQGTATRPDRERWSLRAGESSLVNPPTKPCSHTQATNLPEAPPIQDGTPGDSLRRLDTDQDAKQGDDPRADRGEISPAVQQTKRRVWDILNCGRFHRFTANGLLVHNCLILDLLWQTKALGLAGPASIIAASEEEEEELTKFVRKKRTAEELSEISAEVQRAKEEQLKKLLEAKAREEAQKEARRASLQDARSLLLDLKDGHLLNYEPAMPWEARPASAKQQELLAGFGYDGEALTMGLAGKLLDALLGRQAAGLVPIEAFAPLRAAGVETPAEMTLDNGIRLLGTSFPCTFGKKYRGVPLKDVPKKYWQWLMYDDEPASRNSRHACATKHPATWRFLTKIVFPAQKPEPADQLPLDGIPA